MPSPSPLLDELTRRVYNAVREIRRFGGRFEPEQWRLVMHPNAWDEALRHLRLCDRLQLAGQPDGEARFMGIPVVPDRAMEDRIVLRLEVEL